MSDEIKEILKLLNDDEYSYISLDRESCKLLLDYITNLQEENKDLREENKEAHDFDKTMKDIKDNLIARINRQECEIHNLKEELEAYKKERKNILDKSKRLNYKTRIDKATEYIKNNKLCICKEDEGMMFTAFADEELLNILEGSDKK